MKKLIVIGLALALVISGGVVYANDQIPSAKCAFVWDDIGAIPDTAISEGTAVEILATRLKTGGPKDLVIDLSAETCLTTDVKLDGIQGTSAEAGLHMAVFVDGDGLEHMAKPGWVTFNDRVLEISGNLTHGEWDIEDHWIAIYLETKSANSFNFVKENVGSGPHDIVVKAYKDEIPSATGKTRKTHHPYALALFGNMSMIVDEVNLKFPTIPE